jgi:hypothetical protein
MSIGVCILGLPETVAGIAVNAAILGGAAWILLARPRVQGAGR